MNGLPEIKQIATIGERFFALTESGEVWMLLPSRATTRDISYVYDAYPVLIRFPPFPEEKK